jgi:hypothetical protein
MIRPPLFLSWRQRQPRHLPPRPELFDEEFELELLEELEFEFDELFDDEFELELLDEFELEFDELFDDELDELLPATTIDPSLLAVFAPMRFTSGAEYCLASTAVVASAATPATSADFNFHCFVMAVTPLSGPSDGPAEERASASFIPSAATASRKEPRLPPPMTAARPPRSL